MEKVKEFWNKNKKNLMVVGIPLLIVAAVLFYMRKAKGSKTQRR